MKPFFFLFPLLFISFASAAQWIDGTPMAFEIYERLEPVQTTSAPRNQPAPRLGQTREFFALDFRTGRQYVTSATLRGIGENCYLFVEDRQWNRSVTLLSVELLKKAFDQRSSDLTSRGIFDIVTDTFGDPPDIDGDPRIYILLLQIPATGTNEFISGYFSPINEERGTLYDTQFGVFLTSNEVEMIYLDCASQNPYSESAKSTLAHEMQHLIHWRNDQDEDIWVNEGCSMFASFLCGYSDQMLNHLAAFEREPDTSLTDWPRIGSQSLASYGAVYLWMLYLYEHYGGTSVIRAIARNRVNGAEGIESALQSMGYHDSMPDIFRDWRVANFVDDTNYRDGRFGYRSVNVSAMSRRISSVPVSNIRGTLPSYSTNYLEVETSNQGPLAFLVNSDKPLISDVTLVTLSSRRIVQVNQIPINEDTGFGRATVDRYALDSDSVVVCISSGQQNAGATLRYGLTVEHGGDIDFSVSILPNPVLAGYWEIIAVPSANPGADVPLVRITMDGKNVGTNRQMRAVKNGVLFALSIFVPHDIDPGRLLWQVIFLGEIISSGTFSGG